MMVGAVLVYLFLYSLQQPAGILLAAVMVLAAVKKSFCFYVLMEQIAEYNYRDLTSTSQEDPVCK